MIHPMIRHGTEETGGRSNDASRPSVMVCLSPSPSNKRVIRAASRMVLQSTLSDQQPVTGRAPIALYVGASGREAQEDSRLRENIDYAVKHGFEVHTVQGSDIPLAISEYARREGVTDLFLGYSPPSFFLQTKPAINDKLLAYLPTVDIHIIPDPVSSSYPETIRKSGTISPPGLNIRDLLLVLAVMAVATLLSSWFYKSRFSNSNIITIYILGVLIASVLTSSRLYGTLAAVLYVLLFNFLFIEPRFTLLVYDSGYMMTYLVTVIAALITGTIAVRMKNIARAFAENAYQAKVLLDTSNQLVRAEDSGAIIRTTCIQLVHLLHRAVVFCPPGTKDSFSEVSVFPSGEKDITQQVLEKERDAILWSARNSHQSGAFTGRFSDCSCRYLGVYSEENQYGVIGIDMEGHPFTEFENTLLLSIVHECTMALENKRMEQEQKKAEIRAENERLRAGLLRSISHDLRTPLTSIYGNAMNLSKYADELSEEDRAGIYDDILENAEWLSAQFENILSMTRLESGIGIRRTVENMEDVIEESLRYVPSHHIHQIFFDSASDEDEDQMLFARIDSKLIMQVMINLLNNAVKHTPEGSEIHVRMYRDRDRIVVEVADNGPGIPDSEKSSVFDLFYTGSKGLSDSYRSMGIGLNLCAQIMRAHEGGIEVSDNTPCGAVFRFWLPAEDITEIEEADMTENR